MDNKEIQEREFFGIDNIKELTTLYALAHTPFNEYGEIFTELGSQEHIDFVNRQLEENDINIGFGFKAEVVGIFCILKQEIQEPEDINEETLNRVNNRIRNHHNRIQVKRVFLSNKE